MDDFINELQGYVWSSETEIKGVTARPKQHHSLPTILVSSSNFDSFGMSDRLKSIRSDVQSQSIASLLQGIEYLRSMSELLPGGETMGTQYWIFPIFFGGGRRTTMGEVPPKLRNTMPNQL